MSVLSSPQLILLLASGAGVPRKKVFFKKHIIDVIPKTGLWGFGYQDLKIASSHVHYFAIGIVGYAYEDLAPARIRMCRSAISAELSYQDARIASIAMSVSALKPYVLGYQDARTALLRLASQVLQPYALGYQDARTAVLLLRTAVLRFDWMSYQEPLVARIALSTGLTYVETSYQDALQARTRIEARRFIALATSYQGIRIADVHLGSEIRVDADGNKIRDDAAVRLPDVSINVSVIEEDASTRYADVSLIPALISDEAEITSS